MKVLIAHKHESLQKMLDGAEIEYVAAERDRGVIAENIKDADVYIGDKRVPPTQEELESAANLLLIHTGTGYDFLKKGGIDAIAYATENGIAVASTPGVVARSCAEHTFSLIHQVLGLGARMDEETFDVGPDRQELYGSTFGSVGYGDIGSIACEIARGYGMQVVVHRLHPEKGLGKLEDDPKVTLVEDLDQLLEGSDIVSLHAPETDDTRGMIGYNEFERMKPTAYLINTARGPVVVEWDLVKALDGGLIGGAGIDVYSKEPLSNDPELNKAFMRLRDERKMVATPHMSSNTIPGELRRAQFYFDNILAVRGGEEINAIVNPGYAQNITQPKK